jgi:hypothetical protein
MLELLVLLKLLASGKEEQTNPETTVVDGKTTVRQTLGTNVKTRSSADTALLVILIIFEILLFAWAIFRALKCSQKNPDSRAVHLLFASLSPALYLIFSYAVDGFCLSSR